jgi:hypothetical protein
MTFPETLNTKGVVNELSFPLVAHMAYSDARFDSYGISNSGRGAENVLDRLGRPANNQVLRAEDARILVRVVYKIHRPLTQLCNAYSCAHLSVTTAAVTAVLIQSRVEFSKLPKNGIVNDSCLEVVWTAERL